MSTAFLVDNILNGDKDEPMDSTGSLSDSDDSDSEHNSDLKDSLCDSPKSFNSINNNHHSPLSDEELIRSYTMIREQTDNTDIISDFNCSKCGHFNESPSKLNSIDEKCEKCGFQNEFYRKDTILKEIIPSKPVLKFSVSAILSDTKRDSVKVRNGKNNALIIKITIIKLSGFYSKDIHKT